MAAKKRLAGAFGRAQETIAHEILAAAISEIPGNTTMGELVSAAREAGFGKELESLSLEGFLAAARGAKSGTQRRVGRKQAPRATKRANVNTRTKSGRAQMDAAVAQCLSGQGSVGAGVVRDAVGGDAAQVRQSLARLISAKKVIKSGQKRGTVYTWKGGSAPSTPSKAGGATKKRPLRQRKARSKKKAVGTRKKKVMRKKKK